MMIHRERKQVLVIAASFVASVLYLDFWNVQVVSRSLGLETEAKCPWACTFDPEDTAECSELLLLRLPPPTKYQLPGGQHTVERRRWLFFGDSTMNQHYHMSDLKDRLDPNNGQGGNCPIADVVCSKRIENLDDGNQCALYDVMGFEHSNEWIPPDHSSLEGPRGYGNANPFCKDCGSCKTQFHECSHVPMETLGHKVKATDLDCKNERQVYGGYFSHDFARDVELQTPEFRSTQENYAAYIAHKWNTPELSRDWGKPICVIRNGMHDVGFRGQEKEDSVFDEKYMDNVRWMLQKYQPVCEHIIWLGNTANGNEGNTTLYPTPYRQTMENMKQINAIVKNVIQDLPELQMMMSFIDVYEASLFQPHMDFVHMGATWSRDLGNWLTASFM